MTQMIDTMRVLLVEDDEDHAMLLMRCLDKCEVNNTVDHVTDGEQALNFLYAREGFENRKLPNLILLDLNLPRISGHEVLSTLKSDPEMRVIPVVVLTTSNIEADRIRAYQEHVNSYVVKPFDPSRFRHVIDNVCRYWAEINIQSPGHFTP
ncbi:MAG: response regulator [Phycisphaeraceae bacterium JB051]